MACQNLGQVLNFFTRYYYIQIPTLNIQRADDAQSVILTFARDEVPGSVMRYGIEVIFSALYTNLKILLNDITFPVSFCFDIAEPDLNARSSYRKYLGSDIQFNSDIPKIKFPKSHLNKPIVFSNPLMQRYYAKECERQLNSLLLPQDTVTSVHRLLTATPGYFPTMEQIALQMHVSERTLRRKLDQQGTSYREILDDIRKEQVKALLENSQASIEHIAALMNYSDPANFRRAFKKWMQLSPAAYRKQVTKKNSATDRQ
jgi:AraC-like DNA-binding protein